MDEFLKWYFSDRPVVASSLGADGYDHTLGDFTAASWTAREREEVRWLERLSAAEAASPDDAIDRDLVLSQLRGSIALASWPQWRRDPAVYLSAIFTSMYTPFQHRLKPEPELVTAAISRLAEVPGVLAACQANLDPDLAAPLLVKRGLSQARTGRNLLTGTIPGMVEDAELRTRLAAAAEPAARAFDELVTFLEGFECGGTWRMGERLYSTLLREREMLGYGAAELHEKGRAAWAELDARMRRVAVGVNGDEDWRAAMEFLMDDHPPTLADMRAECEAETRRAREFVRERDLVSFPDGEECQVLPSAEHNRPVLSVAHYLAPPPLSSSRTGVFFVPYTPDYFTPEQVRQRLRTNARAQMPSIAVHEVYPGHHWHLSHMAGNPRTVRKVFRTPYFTEGWALYVEKVLHEQGYFDTPATELAHLDFRLFRAARIVVDTALHCDDLPIEEAETFMATKASLSPGTAQGEVNRYCAWPTQAPSYLTGAIEIDRIRESWQGSLKDFHDRIAGSGGLPLGLAEQVALS
ncbi:DUF885 domain-containing protein [Nonomuraea jiangxiensis]|uniref:Uncharacterized conserved protein, DUF885 familyt n=1 Tax=Nonomuraea jiangxiensis TaxID=633440 RepID=A0A1G9A678_9ACTN|nr:DUF885 domain-containing protein [Nonomuraea jiangxiensis]SDK22384.1 Uncharacterized conserved protein, DUF885 familyt [Nonomuraea jiangxiensis]